MKELIEKIKQSKLWTTQYFGIPLLVYLLVGGVVLVVFLYRKAKARASRLRILRRARAAKKNRRRK